MDANWVLLWFVALSLVAQLRAVVRAARAGLTSGLVALGLVVAVSGLAALLDLARAGFWAFGAFTLVFVVPGLLQIQLRRLTLAQRYAEAVPYARLLAWLHPARRVRRQPSLYRALALARSGDLAGAEAQLTELARSEGSGLSDAHMHLARLQGDWATYLALSERQPDALMARDMSLLFGRLRALGESGQLERMLATYTQYGQLLQGPGMLTLRAQALLCLFAFCGRRAAVELLVSRFLPALRPEASATWIAISACAADAPDARELLFALTTCADSDIAEGARRRLSSPPRSAAGALSPAAEAALDALEEQLRHEAHYVRPQLFKRARLVQSLIAVNVAVFAAEELLGGSEDGATLYRMGALVAGMFESDESYRLVTMLFLHHGPLHLVLNMLGLSAIGPFVESALGWPRMLLLYLCAGVAGAVLEVLYASEPHLVVGASGCIMGLLGATAALLLLDYRARKAQPARSRLGRLLFVLVAQLAFDLTVPNISLAAHWSGVLTGLLFGLALARGTDSKPGRNGATSAGAQSD